ncbi:PIR Superfamily Protein [Plasmodium ovale wallikeri]|uniref:PIR Superfamily Protein n=1 Tax=Plasmodium ovale wallikeri TaxID=864142 RepID=A0A1A9A6G6_PLAOA|nr:PIR Superfamily Protein [Plasmodium ovale wallikeri]SBT58277.1 PIR Superfamily Protein [Plasmodium ovale wallikeri]
MGLSLDDLAMKKPFEPSSEFQNIFNALDNVCTSNDHGYTCESFNYIEVDEPFKSIMVKMLNILKRSTIEENIYTKGISPMIESCLYDKYWFYYKILSDTTGNIDIIKIKNTWRRHQGSIYPIIKKRCKFHDDTLEDIKILNVLYDHIFFSTRTEDKYNLIKEIEKCEFCNHLKNYLNPIFLNKTITSCESDADVLHCPSYSKTEEPGREEISSGLGGDNLLSTLQEDAVSHVFPQNSEGSIFPVKNVIGGISVLGVSSVLFFLYKFTSFGSLINRRTGWITKMLKNPQKNREQLLLRDSETENINSENSQYNLAYTSIQDY